MAVIFSVRPATRNIGNAVIDRATIVLLREAFGSDTSVIGIPAVAGANGGGLTAAQIYDVNRLADGLIIGGGNLFENGQLTVDASALAALNVPMLVLGMSHGRIRAADGTLVARTDAMPRDAVAAVARAATHVLVRDHGSQRMLRALGIDRADVTGCPSMFLPPAPAESPRNDRVLISIRHPARMNVPPALQWRTANDVARLVEALRAAFGERVALVCHDYRDLEFARGFPGVPLLYFDDVEEYLAALRGCRLSVTYRLHAFLPCFAFGTPSIHVSYDERGAEMLATAGMREWDVDLFAERDLVAAVMQRVSALDRYERLRAAARERIAHLRAKTALRLRDFAGRVVAPEREEAIGA